MKAINRLQLLGNQFTESQLTAATGTTSNYGEGTLITPEKIGDDKHQYSMVIDYEPTKKVSEEHTVEASHKIC